MQIFLAAKIEVLAFLKHTADVVVQLWQETWDVVILIINPCICSQAVLWFEGWIASSQRCLWIEHLFLLD